MAFNSSDLPVSNTRLRFQLCRNRKRVWSLSGFVLLFSLAGLIISLLNPSIQAPLRPGLDFTGGTQIQLERNCGNKCDDLNTKELLEAVQAVDFPVQGKSSSVPNLSNARIQLLDSGKSLVARLPFLSASQAKQVTSVLSSIAGPFEKGGESIDTIGPSLGKQLLRSSIISLLVAFAGISIYISIRYDRRYAFLALLALAHDVVIVCGIFSWLGLIINLEVDSLFAVALLTISGYSVNDTVVVFDRIRERTFQDPSLTFNQQIDFAVSSTLTRTLYTSGTTLLPLLALIIFGGATLFWFAVALSLGVVIGSWSSIALAPSLLSLFSHKPNKNNQVSSV